MIDADVSVDIPVDSITARTQKCLSKIKPMIKLRVIKDCNANVPLKTGALRNSALRWAPLTNDYIVWDTPYAHFQHTGKVMIGEHSHSPWAKYGEKKIYTNRNLTYRQGGSRWVEKTFTQRGQSWDRLAGMLFKKEFNK